jgi:hypothetical protein
MARKRRWNEKLKEIETLQQQLACLAEKRCSLSPEEEASIIAMGETFPKYGIAITARQHSRK